MTISKRKATLATMSMMFVFMTCGTKAPFKSFKLGYSAAQAIAAIRTLPQQSDEYQLPEEMRGYTIVPGDDDSSRCYVYHGGKRKILFELGLLASNGNWNKSPCELFVMGFFEEGKMQWEFHREFWTRPDANHPNVKRFESEILPLMKQILEVKNQRR